MFSDKSFGSKAGACFEQDAMTLIHPKMRSTFSKLYMAQTSGCQLGGFPSRKDLAVSPNSLAVLPGRVLEAFQGKDLECKELSGPECQ